MNSCRRVCVTRTVVSTMASVCRLTPRGESDGRSAGDDLLAALVRCPHLELHQVDVVLRRLGEDATPAGHDVLEPHERGEADAELPHRARARPVGGCLGDEAHREHAVGENATHASRPGELALLVDRVEGTAGAGETRELDLLDRTLDERWQLVADLDVLKIDFRVLHRRATDGRL